MTASRTAPGLDEGSRTSGVIADGKVQPPRLQTPQLHTPQLQTPMSQQSALGSHGHDMHPQEFVRLSGCQEPGLRERLAAELRH
jgi:hypothetical protein